MEVGHFCTYGKISGMPLPSADCRRSGRLNVGALDSWVTIFPVIVGFAAIYLLTFMFPGWEAYGSGDNAYQSFESSPASLQARHDGLF